MLQAGGAVPQSPLELILAASPETKVVLVVTGIFSLVSWFIIVYKWWQFRKLNRQADRFFNDMERATRLQDAYKAVMKLPPSPYNRLFREAMTFYSELRPGALRDDRGVDRSSAHHDPARSLEDGARQGGCRRARPAGPLHSLAGDHRISQSTAGAHRHGLRHYECIHRDRVQGVGQSFRGRARCS